MKSFFMLVARLFVFLSLNAKALVVNGCPIEINTSCVSVGLSGADLLDSDLAYANLTDDDLSSDQ